MASAFWAILVAILGFVGRCGRDRWLRQRILGDFDGHVGPLLGHMGGTTGFASTFQMILMAMLGLCWTLGHLMFVELQWTHSHDSTDRAKARNGPHRQR